MCFDLFFFFTECQQSFLFHIFVYHLRRVNGVPDTKTLTEEALEISRFSSG